MAGYHFDPQDYEELQNIVDFASDMVAIPFDASKSYAVGEYCRRESGFYVRNTAGSGAWDASKWTPTTVGDVLKAANAEISALNATLTQLSKSALTFVQSNITGGAANDGIALWTSLGSCYSLISRTGMLNGQPTQWGILVSILTGEEVFQLFHSQPHGYLYFRGGHASDTAMPSTWKRVAQYDEISSMAQSIYSGWSASFSFPCVRGGILMINGGATTFGFWWPGGTFTPVSIKGDAPSAYTWDYTNGIVTVTATGNKAWTFVGG